MKTSLEHIIDSLKLTDEQKAELYENIRNFDLEDDNDPLLRISLFLSILAKFTEEIPDKVAYERQLIELSLKEFKDSCDKLIDQNDSSLKEHKPTADESNNTVNTHKVSKTKRYSKYYFAVILLITVLGIVFNYFYTAKPIFETYQKRKEFLKKCSSLPEVFKVKNKNGWFISIEKNSVTKLQNGQYAAKLKGYY
ncbi:MAG: hypothetical protein K9L78_04865 [Victivallales bacterium]|nr:hypothetical protein [Victivallales bacterium]MCF7889434.1 hypothetical protein [Victivallales bacterium]